MKKCYIFGSAEAVLPLKYTNGVTRNPQNLYIAADRGFVSMRAMGLTPDIISGDFDSSPLTDEMRSSGAEIIRHPVEKDDTDLMLAIKLGFERGYTDFVIVGCLGGERFDHSIATLQSLAYIAEQGGSAVAYGEGEDGCCLTVTAVKNGEIELEAQKRGTVSVFALSEKAEGVSITGLKYELTDATLISDFPLGVSNSFVGKKASVGVKNGTLLVIYNQL